MPRASGKAQSIIEYVILFMVVAGAIALTHRYLYRSVNAKLKLIQEELSYRRSDAVGQTNAHTLAAPPGGNSATSFSPGVGNNPLVQTNPHQGEPDYVEYDDPDPIHNPGGSTGGGGGGGGGHAQEMHYQ